MSTVHHLPVAGTIEQDFYLHMVISIGIFCLVCALFYLVVLGMVNVILWIQERRDERDLREVK